MDYAKIRLKIQISIHKSRTVIVQGLDRSVYRINVLRCFLNVASVDDFLMSGGSSFQSHGAATLNARSPSLSLVRGTTRSRFEADPNHPLASSFLSSPLTILRIRTPASDAGILHEWTDEQKLLVYILVQKEWNLSPWIVHSSTPAVHNNSNTNISIHSGTDWSLTSLFSTNMAIPKMKRQG